MAGNERILFLQDHWVIIDSDGGLPHEHTKPWASYQIRKIAGGACAGNAGNFSPPTDFKGNR